MEYIPIYGLSCYLVGFSFCKFFIIVIYHYSLQRLKLLYLNHLSGRELYSLLGIFVHVIVV
jgi:hypothetical protein